MEWFGTIIFLSLFVAALRLFRLSLSETIPGDDDT